MALHSKQPVRASILVESHCTAFTITRSSHVMRTGKPGNTRYCYVIKPMVTGAHLKKLLIDISQQIFLRDSVCKPKYS